MTEQLIDVGIRRGRLIERIAGQRALLGRQLQPLCNALHKADSGISVVRNGIGFLRQRPGLVVAAVALLVVLRPRRAWLWAKRGFFAWQIGRKVRDQFAAFGVRSRR